MRHPTISRSQVTFVGFTALSVLALTQSAHTQAFTHIKSPASGMRFTQGLPVRIVADGIDPNGWQWLDQQMESKEVHFFVDGVQKASDDHTRGYNHFEALITGLTPGTHTLSSESVNYGNGIATSTPVSITIDPAPVKAKTITLAADIQLSGAQNLDWQDAFINGNGHRVTSTGSWTGSIIIRNSFVTGLAVAGPVIPDSANSVRPGIDVSTNGGSVTIENSTFEWTGAEYLVVNGSGSIGIKNNEFRANAFIGYVSWSPDRSPFMQLKGNCSGSKVFQGNNIGAGFLYIIGMNDWLIGGVNDAQSNVFIGPRTGPRLENCSGGTISGNYSHHDYNGGWSQGFNFWFYNVNGLVTEHNVIRGSSWPVQSVGGEFRYNLIEGCGHEWVRTLSSNTSFHHNILHEALQAGAGGDPNAGIWMYGNQTGMKIYNNSFVAGIDFPAISVSNGSMVASLRNNLFYGFTTPARLGIVDRYMQTNSEETDNNPRLLYADYNCFYSPGSKGPNNYGAGLVSTHTEGSSGWAGHDLGGVNGQADPGLTGGGDLAYTVDESAVWGRTYKLSHVLAEMRTKFSPGTGSPVIDAGDPADGAGVDIGAVGGGVNDPADLFGRFGLSTAVTRRAAAPVLVTPPCARATDCSAFTMRGQRFLSAAQPVASSCSGLILVAGPDGQVTRRVVVK